MTNHVLNISCSGPEPSPVTVKVGDTVEFKNNTTALVELKFSDSEAFKPKKSKIDIVPGTPHTLTISKHKKATTYKWKCPKKPELATRTGRIDPS